MIFKREKYLDKLVAGQGNGMVKIVTGGRRCGKSFLLFNLFHQYLIEHGVDEGHIIGLSLDERKEVFANAIKHDYRSKNPTTRWSDIIRLK